MNPLEDSAITGSIGELLIQIRLMQYDIQVASPTDDSGNDLIAVRGEVFRALQVKTTRKPPFRPPKPASLPGRYHILALVYLHITDQPEQVRLDECLIFLLGRKYVEKMNKGYYSVQQLVEAKKQMCDEHIECLFNESCSPAEYVAVPQATSSNIKFH